MPPPITSALRVIGTRIGFQGRGSTSPSPPEVDQLTGLLRGLLAVLMHPGATRSRMLAISQRKDWFRALPRPAGR